MIGWFYVKKPKDITPIKLNGLGRDFKAVIEGLITYSDNVFLCMEASKK